MPDAGGPPVRMVREHLRDLPRHDLPAGYRLRGMTPSDVAAWLAVQRDAEPYLDIGDELFAQQFGTDESAIADRCLLLEAPDGGAIGTISAWRGSDDGDVSARLGEDPGRIHWVAIRPAWQGRGLAKPTLAAALALVAGVELQAPLHQPASGTSTATNCPTRRRSARPKANARRSESASAISMPMAPPPMTTARPT